MTSTVTSDRIVADVAEVLSLKAEEIGSDVDLSDLGLDSVRLMTLVERWRGAGADADFSELAQDPTLEAWVSVLCP
ncbi:aryl carrier-like protein [Rhodococcus sp. 27YEA15]|uniref:phosphopantetheine-binding protein n=1 Tax=Rhodococcus sp. 27YEA15 TaxID=3156259 RepID=UPI003C7DB368